MRTRSGRESGRYEAQVEQYHEYNRPAPCEQCSQEDNDYEYGDNNDEDAGMRNGYRPRDECKRHRLPDNTPYTEEVTSYRRRKPIGR